MSPGKLQKVEVSMFKKKTYNPIVHGKASAFALFLAEKAVRFVLQDDMIRFFHFTMDEMSWDEPNQYSGHIPHFRSEITASVMCRDGKLVEMEAEIILMKRDDGKWIHSGGIESYRLKFPGCGYLKGAYIYFDTRPETDGEIVRYCVWWVSVDSKDGTLPEDAAMCEVREKLITT